MSPTAYLTMRYSLTINSIFTAALILCFHPGSETLCAVQLTESTEACAALCVCVCVLCMYVQLKACNP